jgi:hypothetical protein
MFRRTVTLDSELLEKVRSLRERIFSGSESVNFAVLPVSCCKLWWYAGLVRFFALVVIAAFCHDGLMEAASEVVGQLVNLVIAVNFDGLFGGIHHNMAFVAPM